MLISSAWTVPLYLRSPLSILLMLVMMASSTARSSVPKVLIPEASGTRVEQNEWVRVDLSHIDEGYVMVEYLGEPHKTRMQVAFEDNTPYTYDLATDGRYETFPLSCGNGSYTLNVYSHLKDNTYVYVFGTTFDVTLKDQQLPFLYPNQYVDFKSNNAAVGAAQSLSKGAADDLDVVSRIYEYVIDNIDYDYDKLNTVTSGYLPDIDQTLRDKKGICFDYASLMTAMLRSQRIPTKLVIGYAGEVYHAWINVYTEETGWVNGIIRFDGTTWVRMDPTYAAGNSEKHTLEYVNNSDNYNELFFY